MSQIIKEFDNKLNKSQIIVPLLSSSKAEGGDNYIDSNLTDVAQTSVFGIQVPLIMINNTVIDFDAVKYFNLKSEGKLPELNIVVEDKYQLINNIDKPSNDNEIRVQILPKFDNAYKKIDLTFYISNIRVNGSLIRLSGSYKLSSLTSSKFMSFGEIDTYNLFKTAATDTGLGFASNIVASDDSRYMYCDNKSWLELLDDEIQYSSTNECIIDYWIDLWDNINLVDIKERYNTVDSDDDLMIWITGQTRETTVDIEIVPQKINAVINNHPGNSGSELFVKNYEIINNPGSQISKGSDKLYGIYEENKDEYLDHLLQDGDVKNDIFAKYEYLGENYGDYNYLLSKYIRSGFIQKINTEKIKVTLQSPLLGLMRGHKVNFIRYVNDDKVESKMKALEEAEVIDRNIDSNISLSEYENTEDSGNGQFRVDKTVSAQYLIHAVDIIYNNNSWDYVLTLIRPTSTKPNIIIK